MPGGTRGWTARSALAAGALALMASSPGRADQPVRVGATGSAIGMLSRLGQAFEKAHPGDRLALPPSLGSSGAVKALASGAVDLGVSGRELKPEEAGLGLRSFAFARTPFLFAAGPRGGGLALDAAQLARILRGEVTAWPGGERIRPVLRPNNDADTQFVRSISPELAAAMDAALARTGVVVAASNQECEEALARTPGAFGFTSLAQLRTEGRALTPLTWNGVAPTLESQASGAYPLVKSLHVLVPASPRPAARRFLAFLATEEARRVVREAGAEPAPFALPD